MNGLAYDFPERLNRLIVASHMTQAQFAESVGVRQSTFDAWCCGTILPDLEGLARLILRTGRSANWWLGLEDTVEADGIRLKLADMSNRYVEVCHELADTQKELYKANCKIREIESILGKVG